MKNYVYFFENLILRFFFIPFTWIKFVSLKTENISIVKNESSRFTNIVNKWGNRDPLFKITDQDDEYRMNFLKKFGMKEGD